MKTTTKTKNETTRALSIKDIKAIPYNKHLTDAEAEYILQTLKKYARVLFEASAQIQRNGKDDNFL